MKFSTRLLRKGALIQETRIVLQLWEERGTVADSVHAALNNNPIGAKTDAWLKEVIITMISRLSMLQPETLDGLRTLARSNVSQDIWRACWHWHCAKIDLLYYNFSIDWLFAEFKRGAYRLRTEDVLPFVVAQVTAAKGEKAHLSDYGATRAARDLLRMATDFELLSGHVAKEFQNYHLPDESFLYVLHSMAETESSAPRIIHSKEWHLFLMDPSDVERELLRLHQFRKVHYEVAGSLARLTLPHNSSAEYARNLSV